MLLERMALELNNVVICNLRPTLSADKRFNRLVLFRFEDAACAYL